MKKAALLLSLFLSQLSLATVPVDQMIAICSPYPEIKTDSAPTEFNSTNNLARSKDSAFYQAEGEKIVIYGRLMDSNCVPVNDGKIYVWQNNSKGYAQYLQNKPKWIDPNFTGTGMTNSDNLGRSNFITIKPGSVGKNTPYINIKIEHPRLKTFSSKIYFTSNNNMSIKNKKKTSAVPGDADSNGNVTTYFIDITLNQTIMGKEY